MAEQFKSRGLTPYVFSEGLEQFYSESDAFIFESAVWNRNRIKTDMRHWIARRLAAMPRRRDGEQLSVLCIGDGLGFDSAFLAGKGHAVTYHEVPGPHEAFARSVFERANVPVRVVTNQKELNEATFDVIVCLDVLEHVPDPPSFVGQLLPLLRPQGRLIVHAPFYMIHPAYPTHLKRNRAHSGSLRLYTQQGLRLVDGKLFWNPLMLQRASESGPSMPAVRRLLLAAAGAYLALGRWTALPLRPIHTFRRVRSRWFG